MNEDYNLEMVFDTETWMWMTRKEYLDKRRSERS